MVFPRELRPGDRVAIVSPASVIEPERVTGTVATLGAMGFDPVVYPHSLGRHGSFSGSREERLEDLRRAFLDERVRAIICSRGGYGTVHLVEALADLDLAKDPKWVVGFSDISALHALLASRGIVSVHGSMAKQLAEGPKDEINQQLYRILRGERPSYRWAAHEYNHKGKARGTLRGGNLAVLGGLIGTPYDDLLGDSILFIEDIAEPIYKVERILYGLRLAGVLPRLRGLIVGQFTEYRPSLDYEAMEDMVRDMVEDYGYPVAFNAPVGHVDCNVHLLHGSEAELRVDDRGAWLSVGVD